MIKNFFKLNIYFYYFIFFFFSLFVFNVLKVTEEYYISIGLFLFIYLFIYFLFFEINDYLIDGICHVQEKYIELIEMNLKLKIDLYAYFQEDFYLWEFVSKVILVNYFLKKLEINYNLIYINLFKLYYNLFCNYNLFIFFNNIKFYLNIFFKTVLRYAKFFMSLEFKIDYIYYCILNRNINNFFFFYNNSFLNFINFFLLFFNNSKVVDCENLSGNNIEK